MIANSRSSAALARGAGAPSDRIAIVHPGVDLQRFNADASGEAARRAYGLAGRRVLLTVGRLTPRKGQDAVIEAVARLARQIPDLVYLVVGRGEDERRLRRLAAERGVAECVIFAGLVDDCMLASCYAACEVFVMPNRQLADGDLEGFGMVFVEAAACGKPTIGGRSGGAVEAIVDGETGLVVDPTRPTELTRVIRHLLIDPQRARAMGEAGRRRAHREFGWERISERIQSLMRPAHRHVAQAALGPA